MNIKQILKDYRLLEIFILGIISGMPLAIIYSTLSAWLKESGISLEVITTFAVARLSYSLKFLWAPFIDYFKIPILSKLGHRKSWLVICSSFIALILFSMSKISPQESLSSLYFLTICLGIFSATYDISFDAFRIEKFEQELQGIATANTVFGYRIGMLITGGMALEIAHLTNSWSVTFLTLSVFFILGTLFIITIKEPSSVIENNSDLSLISREKNNVPSNLFFVKDGIIKSLMKAISIRIKKILIDPFKDFLLRDGALIILMAVIFFKLGDAMLGVVSMPFYLELGYTKEQIAIVVKGFGLIATILGTYAGGYVVYRLGHFRGLIITGVIQTFTHVAFIWLNHQNADFNALLVAITIENLGGGMGSSAVIAYLSILCNKKYSATQYALLSSCATFFNNSVTIYGGKLVQLLGWDNFFILTILLALPGIALFIYLNKM